MHFRFSTYISFLIYLANGKLCAYIYITEDILSTVKFLKFSNVFFELTRSETIILVGQDVLRFWLLSFRFKIIDYRIID